MRSVSSPLTIGRRMCLSSALSVMWCKSELPLTCTTQRMYAGSVAGECSLGERIVTVGTNGSGRKKRRKQIPWMSDTERMKVFEHDKKCIIEGIMENKGDKSLAGQVDVGVKETVSIVNDISSLVTLSSCSGRLCLYHRAVMDKEDNILFRDGDDVVVDDGVGAGGAKKPAKKRGSGLGTLFETHFPFVMRTSQEEQEEQSNDMLHSSSQAVPDNSSGGVIEDDKDVKRGNQQYTSNVAVENAIMSALKKFNQHLLKEERRACEKLSSPRYRHSLELKFEPFILHVGCASVEDACRLLQCANESGQRRSGVLGLPVATYSRSDLEHTYGIERVIDENSQYQTEDTNGNVAVRVMKKGDGMMMTPVDDASKRCRRITVNINSSLGFTVPLLLNGRVGGGNEGGKSSLCQWVVGNDWCEGDSMSGEMRSMVKFYVSHASALFESNEERKGRFVKELKKRFA